MKILATDLDRTLLPNGHWPADEQAIPMFNELTASHDVLVVYVTGRNLDLTEQAIEQFGVRHPDVLVGDVGTTIRRFDNGQWHDDAGWAELIRERSPAWDNQAVRAAVAGIAGLTEQAPEHLNAFKQSYDVDHTNRESILAQVDERVKGHFDEVIIYSYDSQADKGLLDFLPNSATKLTGLEYVAEQAGVDKDSVVFCGDSGNDIFPLTAGFNGVLVRNADEQLVENVQQARQDKPQLKLYFAKGDFKGLNGHYTSGVIEGAYHYGLF
ncbi:MAG: HAD-IIB family hydrolase [Chromatiales bacterium]|jgi:sucrose-6F-phosphate phosphohydrolase